MLGTADEGLALRITAGRRQIVSCSTTGPRASAPITIGAYPDWSVAAARQAAKDTQARGRSGRDPMGERQPIARRRRSEIYGSATNASTCPQSRARKRTSADVGEDHFAAPRQAEAWRDRSRMTIGCAPPRHHHDPRHAGARTQPRRRDAAQSLQPRHPLEMARSTIQPAGVRRNPEEPRSRYLNRPRSPHWRGPSTSIRANISQRHQAIDADRRAARRGAGRHLGDIRS